jgi:hypothetical protein
MTTEIAYIETTIAPGVTIPEYRRARPPRRRWWHIGLPSRSLEGALLDSSGCAASS